MFSRSQYLHCLIIISKLLSTSASGPPVFSVDEQSPVGTEIGHVINQHDVDEDSRPVPAQVRYRIRSPSSQYFNIDQSTGLLRTAAVLDREELCPYLPFCELVVNVIGTRLRLMSYEILVADFCCASCCKTCNHTQGVPATKLRNKNVS